MKKIVLYVLMLCLAPMICLASFVNKEKQLLRTYPASAVKELDIDNSFGSITVHTWSKAEVSISITIRSKAHSESKAAEILKHAIMDETNKHGIVSFRSGPEENYNISGGNELRIFYVINIPENCAMKLENKFGDIDLPDLTGQQHIRLSFGNLKTGSLTHNGNDVILKFGDGTIGDMNGGKLDVQHFNINTGRLHHVNASFSFGKVRIESGDKLTLIHKFGSLKMGDVRELNGTIEHAPVQIEKLSGTSVLEMKFSQGSSIQLAEGGHTQIDASYSKATINTGLHPNLTMDAIVEYGSLKSDSNNPLEVRKTGSEGHSKSFYTGKAGAGTGTLKINSKFSHIKLR